MLLQKLLLLCRSRLSPGILYKCEWLKKNSHVRLRFSGCDLSDHGHGGCDLSDYGYVVLYPASHQPL